MTTNEFLQKLFALTNERILALENILEDAGNYSQLRFNKRLQFQFVEATLETNEQINERIRQIKNL